ncbi:hypothetical protein GCM10010191_03790 [Actinomadura vinacea]|uniref:LysM domain-containing protein n=1 Tax=Actinomadura vinacea TaxID=115336 RepID=A0ABN3IBA1_9ACTN
MTALIFTTSTALAHPMTSTPAHATSAAPETKGPAAPASVATKQAPLHETRPATSRQEQSKQPRFRTRIVKRGDTLWAIARREYGSGTRYPKIFKASRRLTQPEDLPPLTDPDRIYPGQKLRLPPTTTNNDKPSSPNPSKPVAPKNASGPSGPSTQAPDRSEETPSPRATHSPASRPISAPPPPVDPRPLSQPSRPHSPPARQKAEHTERLAITLPSGACLGLASASPRPSALRWRPPAFTGAAAERSTPASPEPTPPAAVAQAHRAHLDSYADRDEPIPNQITLGTGPDGAITLPLPGLGLGLEGDGAVGTLRAIATELLARARADRVELLIASPDAQTLFPDTDIPELAIALPGLVVPPTLNAAITHLEAESSAAPASWRTPRNPTCPASALPTPPNRSPPSCSSPPCPNTPPTRWTPASNSEPAMASARSFSAAGHTAPPPMSATTARSPTPKGTTPTLCTAHACPPHGHRRPRHAPHHPHRHRRTRARHHSARPRS